MAEKPARRIRIAALKNSEYAMTHAEIAAQLGITSGGVHMAEKAGLRKARSVLAAKGISETEALAVLRML